MKLTEQVTSLEVSKKLKELGVKQKSLFYYHEDFEGPIFGQTLNRSTQVCNQKKKCISAFTLSEMNEMMKLGPSMEVRSTLLIYMLETKKLTPSK